MRASESFCRASRRPTPLARPHDAASSVDTLSWVECVRWRVLCYFRSSRGGEKPVGRSGANRWMCRSELALFLSRAGSDLPRAVQVIPSPSGRRRVYVLIARSSRRAPSSPPQRAAGAPVARGRRVDDDSTGCWRGEGSWRDFRTVVVLRCTGWSARYRPSPFRPSSRRPGSTTGCRELARLQLVRRRASSGLVWSTLRRRLPRLLRAARARRAGGVRVPTGGGPTAPTGLERDTKRPRETARGTRSVWSRK
jgi:hypothetical protein